MNPDSLTQALEFTYSRVDEYSRLRFFLLGETLTSLLEGTLQGEELHLGMRKKWINDQGELYKQSKELLRQHIPGVVITDDEITFIHNRVPVRIQLIKKDYPFLEHLDFVFWKIHSLSVPNPVDDYLEFVKKEGDLK